ARLQRCRYRDNAGCWRSPALRSPPAGEDQRGRPHDHGADDRQYLARPYYGSPRVAAGAATPKARRQPHTGGAPASAPPPPMRLASLVAIYQRPNTSKPAVAHKIYLYLLGGLSIERVNQVWCSDVTYIPMAKGFLYLVVIMDWVSRAVLAWRPSNTLGADFCV